MTLFFRVRAIFSITFKRLWAQKGLSAAFVIGITVAIALIMTVPLYANAVYYRILQARLGGETDQRRPPFTYMFNYVGDWFGPVQLEDTQAVDEYLRGSGQQSLGLQLTRFIRYYESERTKLFPINTEDYGDARSALGIFNYGTATDFEKHIKLIDGLYPQHNSDPTAPIEVLVTEDTANKIGLQAGDSVIAYDFRNPDNGISELPITIAGVWRPLDEESSYWFIQPASFDDVLMVAEATFVEKLAPIMPDEINWALWYFVMDGEDVNTTDVERLLAGAWQVTRQVDVLLPNTSEQISPVEALIEYRNSVYQLQLVLIASSVPIIALVVAFIVMIVGLTVDRRRNEFAVMRSRGATALQMVGLAAMEGVVLGFLSFVSGTLLALLITQLMGKTQSFLNFSAPYQLTATLTEPALYAGLLGIGLAVVAQVLPTLAASRDTIISYEQDQARSLKKPIWQRAWLDVILLTVTAYSFYLLKQQGSLFALSDAARDDLFQNPLLLVLPSLAVFSLTLLFIRLFPMLMEVISWLLGKSDSVGLLLASRELARRPRAYTMPLLILVLTISLAVFTASLAFTLDLQLRDEARYQVGADVNLKGAGLIFNASGFNPRGVEEEARQNKAIFLPISEYETFPGVVGATRVGRYGATVQVGGTRTRGTFMGVDRGTFSTVAFWRFDFAERQINALMNQLSTVPDGVLVSQLFLKENGLRLGDFVRLVIRVGDGNVVLDGQIAGVFDYFPTWYQAEDGPLFVGNLDTLFTLTGGDQSYEVWLYTDSVVEEAAFQETLTERQLYGWHWKEPYTFIQIEQARPARQGLFGLLSVGFVATAMLTVMGFFIYTLFSFRRRAVILGILRAIGLSSRQMRIAVGWETAALIFVGLTLGTFFGVWISKLFIPYLQIGRSASDFVPPYLVEIAWPAIYQLYGLFVFLFITSSSVLIVMLRRMKIFEAIKLGETV